MLNVGIVGAGLRGRLFADALSEHPGVRVVGFAEPSERAGTAAAAAGHTVVPDHTALLADLNPDAVIVATPDFAHRAPAVDVALAGKDMLIEKPLATTMDDAEAIAAAVAQGGGRCLVGFENRWNPHVLRTHEALTEGDVGRPITSSATLSNSYFVPTQMLSWAARSSPAWFLMPHTLDMLMLFHGSEVESVAATSSRGQLAARGVDTDDVVHALVKFEDGTTANLTSAWTLPDSGEGIVDFTYQVIGTEGAVRADLGHQGLSVVTDRTRSVWPLGSSIGSTLVGPAVWMVRHFVDRLIDGGDLGPGADHGLNITRTICAIERAAETGTTVRLNEFR